MLTRIKVKQFQSLADVDVELGPLTVIVGPTNSGKSAFVRAVTSLGRNSVPAGTGVRVGSKSYNVTAECDDGVSVTIERGASLSRYSVRGLDGEDVYEKSGQSVPDDVAATLRFAMAEDADLAFSTQHDGPFMMSASGSSVARVLGSLTAATLLHDAVKEANRRKLSHDRQAKTREEDSQALADRARNMGDLRARAAAVSESREMLDAVASKAGRVDALRKMLQQWATVESALSVVQSELPFDAARLEAALEIVERKSSRLSKLNLLYAAWVKWGHDAQAAEISVESASAEIGSAEAALVALWDELGVCPTCGQEVHA